MKQDKLTVGSWTWYVIQIKEARPGVELDYQALMKKYISGVKWEDAL